MDLSWLPPLVGTVVGGALTYFTQARVQAHAARTAQSAAAREVEREHFSYEREAVVTLLERVAADLAWVREEVIRREDDDDMTREMALHALAGEITVMVTKATPLIARVGDKEVRAAARHAYKTWGEWCAHEGPSIDSEDPGSADSDPRLALDRFSAVVAQHLEALAQRARNAMAPTGASVPKR